MCTLGKHLLALTVLAAAMTCVPLTTPAQEDSPDPYFGNWALTLPGDGPGWLTVRQENGYLEAELLWYGGSVTPVEAVYMGRRGRLYVVRSRQVVRERDSEGKPTRVHRIPMTLMLQVEGDTLTGRLMNPDDSGLKVNMSEEITGKRIPPPPDAPNLAKLKLGDPVELFNGKNLDGWVTMGDNKNGWAAKNGVLANNPVQEKGKPHISYANIKTEAEFEDFQLHLEVNVPKGSNSGIYLRGIYEVQVSDSYGAPLDSHNMGGVYSRIKPTVNAEKRAGQWQTFDITLCDRHITVVLNEKTIIDNQPVLGCTGGAITSNEFIPGPIYLQGDHGAVEYRNIALRPILK